MHLWRVWITEQLHYSSFSPLGTWGNRQSPIGRKTRSDIMRRRQRLICCRREISLSGEHSSLHSARSAFACFKGWQCHLHRFNESLKKNCGHLRKQADIVQRLSSPLITHNIGLGLQTKHCYTDNQELWHLRHREVVFFAGKKCAQEMEFHLLLNAWHR